MKQTNISYEERYNYNGKEVAKMLKKVYLILLVALLLGVYVGVFDAAANGPTPEEQLLGKFLFFDENLSTPPGQSCAACHAPEVGFTGPDPGINLTTVVYPGAVHTRFGNRKPPTAAYGGDSPVLYYDGTRHAVSLHRHCTG